MNKKRFLVLGATGMLGHLVSIYLCEQGHDVTGFSRKEVGYVKSIVGNVRDLSQLMSLLSDGNFDAVINAVGVLNQFAEKNKEDAVFINSYLPHFLAKITDETRTQIIQISTDCVFSGNHAPYSENSIKDGESFYSITKSVGELMDEKNLTLRCSIVGPDLDKNGIGLLNWFMNQTGEIYGYTNAMWTGLTTLQLAKIIEEAVEEKAYGLVNMVNEHNISKYKLLKMFNHYMREDTITIKRKDDYYHDMTLVRTNFAFDYEIPGYEIMVKELAEWMNLHNDLYEHYYK